MMDISNVFRVVVVLTLCLSCEGPGFFLMIHMFDIFCAIDCQAIQFHSPVLTECFGYLDINGS